MHLGHHELLNVGLISSTFPLLTMTFVRFRCGGLPVSFYRLLGIAENLFRHRNR